MPEDPTPDTPAPADTPDTSDPAGDGPWDDTSEIGRVRREAAGYRTRLREAENARDELREQVDSLRRGEVERLARGLQGLADGSDLWKGDVTLDGLLGDDGRPDPQRVKDAVQRVLQDHPHWRFSALPSFDQGTRPDVGPGPEQPKLSDALRARGR